MTHPGFTRNYESTLALLAERGHRVHLAFDGPPQVGKPSAIDGLEGRYPSISHGAAPDRDDVWSPLAGAARATRNYLRYLHPRYRQATRLREYVARGGFISSIARPTFSDAFCPYLAIVFLL